MKKQKRKAGGGKCAVLVCSCDKNEDVWDMFFYYFKKHWKGCDMPIYLNTESREYRYEGMDIKTFSLFPDGDRGKWSLRLKEHLKRIPENYVILILEDFFFMEDVDEEEIERCICRMEEDPQIAMFLFMPTPGPNLESEYERYEKKAKKAPFRFSLQAGIWRRDKLIHYIREHEGPWQFETWGSMRSRRYKETFYALKQGAKKVFTYPGGGYWRTTAGVHMRAAG